MHFKSICGDDFEGYAVNYLTFWYSLYCVKGILWHSILVVSMFTMLDVTLGGWVSFETNINLTLVMAT